MCMSVFFSNAAQGKDMFISLRFSICEHWTLSCCKIQMVWRSQPWVPSQLSMSKWNNFNASYSFWSLEQYLFLDSKLCWLCFKPQSNFLQTFVEVWCLKEAWSYKNELMIQTNPHCYDLHNASFIEFHCPPVLTDGISEDIIPGEFMPRLA